MNKKIVFGCLTILLGYTCLASSIHNQDCHKGSIPVISIENITQEMRNGFEKGEFDRFIIKCPAGTELSLNLFIKGDLLDTEQKDSPIVITCKQTFYIYYENDHWQFSLDGCQWKELTEFVRGDICSGLELKEGRSQATLGLEIYLKNE
jgi:hypothetical protein